WRVASRAPWRHVSFRANCLSMGDSAPTNGGIDEPVTTDGQGTVPGLPIKSVSIDAFILALSCAAAAVVADLCHFHRSHYSDSLVPILTSLYHWTPFYWDQNRFGMLIPLLALPFRNPLWNLLFQSGLTLFAGFAGLVLLVRYVATDDRWPVPALVAVL